MGFAFHITRAEYWFENEEMPILQEEWERAADEYGELNLTGYVDWKDIGAQKVFGIDGEVIAFSWREGNVNIEGGWSDVAEKVANDLAQILGGKVQGDEVD